MPEVRSRFAAAAAAATVTAAILLVWPGRAALAGETVIGSVNATQLSVPDGDGGLDRFAGGGGLSATFLDIDDDVTGGFEIGTLFLRGDGDERLYDLSLSMLASTGLEGGKSIAPFIIFGLDVAAAVVPPPGGEAAADDRWVSIGVHGGVGAHGFLGEKLYWRAQVGWLGAGVGGTTVQLSLGYVMGDL